MTQAAETKIRLSLGTIIVAVCTPFVTQALEQVTVTFYEQGLTNKTVRHEEGYITDGGGGLYRVDIDVESASVYSLATNYVGGLEQGGNLFDTFSRHSPTLFVRNTNFVGFTCQNAYDNQPLTHDGESRNGTLISTNEVLYVGHYYASHQARSVVFCDETGKVHYGYPLEFSVHPSKDLALVKLDRNIPSSVMPAKVFTQLELDLFPYRTPLVAVDRFNVVRIHFEYASSLYDWETSQFYAYGDGDSGTPLFIKTGKTIYVVGKMKAPSGWDDVTKEDIELMREMLSNEDTNEG